MRTFVFMEMVSNDLGIVTYTFIKKVDDKPEEEALLPYPSLESTWYDRTVSRYKMLGWSVTEELKKYPSDEEFNPYEHEVQLSFRIATMTN